jgi:hypothetical protein
MSAHPHQTLDRRRLKHRLDYFFRSEARARGEVAQFAQQMRSLGQVAVIGGMLRNLCLDGTREFISDVDFVIDCVSIPEFERIMKRLDAKQNRFGGFGISLSRWKVDIWPLQRTWAAVEGYIRIEKLDDLINATFFNWDEAIYRLDDHKLTTAPEYFEWLSRRLLEINLEANPNPMGNAIRALRYAWRWNAMFGPRLARHVLNQLRDHRWEKFLVNEQASFAHRVLDQLDGDRLFGQLKNYEKADGTGPLHLGLQPHQVTLPFN